MEVYQVKSVKGLEMDDRFIREAKPIILADDRALIILPSKSQRGRLVTFTAPDGEITFRVVDIQEEFYATRTGVV